MKRFSAILIALLLVVACAPRVSAPPSDLRALHLAYAVTEQGPVAGVADGGISIFRGVPYARPPVGALRFAPPQEPEPRDYLLPAVAFGPAPPQGFDKFESASMYSQSEDCLTLNVWTPGIDGKRRPVLFYIYGGGFIEGGTSNALYDGAAFARRGGIVFVSANYRLGANGFLYLDEQGEEFKGSGNLGLLDQVAALKWVRANIERFGGDPSNVTIMGQSAGSVSVTTLLSMPAAKGLFQKAIAQSGAPTISRTRQEAARGTKRFMEIAGVRDAAGLRKLTTAQVVKAQLRLLREGGLDAARLFSPVVDGVVLPEEPLAAIEKGSAAGVTLLHGTNKDEFRLWFHFSQLLRFVPPKVLLDRAPGFAAKLAPYRDRIIAHYRKAYPKDRNGDTSMRMATDLVFWVPHLRLAAAQAGHAKTWMYQFNWPSPVSGGIYGADHGLELAFVFRNLRLPGAEDSLGKNPPEKLADAMNDAWTAFARTGDPGIPGLPQWPAYDMEKRATMFFDEACTLEFDPRREDRELYRDIRY